VYRAVPGHVRADDRRRAHACGPQRGSRCSWDTGDAAHSPGTARRHDVLGELRYNIYIIFSVATHIYTEN
jgi:hypothetical protein